MITLINRAKRGVSPVIATVVLVAVAITISVGMAFYMGGISSQYTKFEKVEIQSAVSVWSSADDHWNITMKMKNTGTSTSTLNGVFINEIEVNAYGSNVTAPPRQAVTDMEASKTITSGETITISVVIDGPGNGQGWGSITAGTSINIKIHSAGGMDYMKMLTLS